MAEDNIQRGTVYNANDSLDINELASLNEDISPEFLEQLQNQVAQNAGQFIEKPETQNEDSELFEEIKPNIEPAEEVKKDPVSENPVKINIDNSIDDNFIKKYKAKLNKQQNAVNNFANAEPSQTNNEQEKDKKIENLTSGNITEKPLTQEQVNYNDSLDFLDENIKYSKYVIYIDPENTEFIESLTVKERKNLINRILREQDDIAITKRRLNPVQTVIKHSIIAIITAAIAIPVVYYTINASLEASIDNYRRSQSIFKTLYREKGKIQTKQLR